MEWQPIDKTPSETGVYIVFFKSGRVGVAWFFGEYGDMWSIDYDPDYSEDVTDLIELWQYLPKPPCDCRVK